MAGPLICEPSGLQDGRFTDFHLSLKDLQIVTVQFPHQELKEHRLEAQYPWMQMRFGVPHSS